MAGEAGVVHARRDDGVGWLVFDNPGKLNAVSNDMLAQALDIVRDFEGDPAVKVVVMRGAGEKAFISGGDISKFEGARDDAAAERLHRQVPDRFQTALAGLSKPVIAMIRGYCLGGGMGIALCADMRFASTDSKFGIPAARRGIAYGLSGLKRLVDVVGPSIAKDLMFSARQVQAGEALEMGLVNRLYPPDELEAATLAYARLVAGNAPLSVRASKFFIGQLAQPEKRRDQARMQRMIDEAAESADFKEATRAFLEKRKPVFRGE